MAREDAVIRIVTEGEERLNRVLQKINQLESVVESFNRKPIDVSSSRAIANVGALQNSIKQLDTEIAKSQSAIQKAGSDVEKYGEKIAKANSIIESSTPNTQKYNRAVEARREAQLRLADALKLVAAGQQKIEAAQGQKAGAIENLIDAERIKKATIAINSLADEYLAFGKLQISGPGIELSTAQLTAQANALQVIANNSRIASTEFNRFTIASAVAKQSVFEAQQERLKTLATGLSVSGGKLDVGSNSIAQGRKLALDLIQSYPGIVKSEAALGLYLNRLEELKAIVPILSDEYRGLEETAAAVRTELSAAGLKGQTSAINPTQGPAINRFSLQASAQKSAYEKLVNKELERQFALGQRISQANLEENQKTILRNRLEQASTLLAEHRLDDAKSITGELDRQRISLERMNLAAKQTREEVLQPGVLGTSFLPVSGQMPGVGGKLKGAVIPGSPAAKELEQKGLADIEAATNRLQSAFNKLRDSSASDEDLVAYKNGLEDVVGIGRVRLDQLRNEDKLLEKRIAALSRGETSGSAKMQQKAVADMESATGKLESIFNKLRASSLQSKDLDAYTNKMNEIVEIGQARLNQLAQEEKGLAQAVDRLRQRYVPSGLKDALTGQLTEFRTLQANFQRAQVLGAKVDPRVSEMLQNQIAELETGSVKASSRIVDVLQGRLKAYRQILGEAQALLGLERAIEGQSESSATAAEKRGKLELARNRLKGAAIDLEGRMIGLEGRGVQLASERAELESILLDIQAAQNSVTAKGNVELAIRLKGVRNLIKAQENLNATEQGAGQTRMLGGVRAKFNEMFPKGPGGRRQVTEQGFENIALGAGFPLMFGGGPGTVAGGLLGSFVGAGFGGQILGGAIGQIIDQAVISVKNLNDAFLTAGDSYSQLRQTGLQFTAELERQVMAAKSIGDFERARQIQAGPMLQMGDVGGIGVSGTAAAVGVLQNAWNGVYKTVALTVGILGSPFIALLGLILRIVQGIFGVVNLVLTGLGTLILKIPGLKKMIDDSNESILDGNAAYQDQLAELNKQSDELSRILSTKSKIFQITAGTVGTSKENFEIEKRRGEQIQRQADLEAKIQEIRRKAPLTKGGEAKANEIIAKERAKFLMEEFSIAANNAQSLFQEVQSHNREIALAKIDLEKQVRDMQRESAEQQRAINLETARKVEDMMLDRQGKELDFIKRRRDLEIDAAKVAAQEASSQRQFASILAGTSAQDSLLNTTLDALDAWKIGRDQVENDARDKQMKLQLDLKRMDVEMQRYREDSALRIAKINFDSQRKIADMNQRINRQNDEVERKRFSMRIEAAKAEIITIQSQAAADKAKVLLFAGTNTIASQLQADQLNMAMDIADLVRGNASKLLQILGAIRPAAPIANVGQLPTLTMDTGAATAQYEQTRQMVNQNEQQLAANQKELDLRKNNLELGEKIRNNAAEYVKTLNQANDENSKSLRIQDMYRNNLARGILPDLAEQLAQQDDLFNAQAKSFRETYNAVVKFNEIAKDPAIAKIIADLKQVGGAMATAYDTMQAATEARFSPEARIAAARTQIRESVLELQDPANQFIMAMDAVAKIEQDLYRLTNPVYQLVDAAKAMGSAFGDSFKGVISGSMSAQEALANFFQRTADHFLDMAAQIIAQQAVLKLISFGLGLIPGFGAAAKTDLGPAAANLAQYAPLPGRAMGGPVTGGMPYMVGERGPELFVPGSSGSIVPNHQLGGGDVSIMVNVDASGTSVQGDDQKGSELGRLVAVAVRQEMIKQKRPGGILAS